MPHTAIDTEQKYVKMKKEVYEHLAQTFLEKKSKKKFKNRDLWLFSILITIFCFLIILGISSFAVSRNIYPKSLFVIQDKTPIEIRYDFTAMGDNKVRALSYNLNEIDLTDYSKLSLSLRSKEKSKIDSAIKVEIENALLEKDAEYLTGINSSWKNFILPLSSFEKISDWSSVTVLTFVVEEWNIDKKEDRIYIDDVKFMAESDKKAKI